LNLPGIQSAQKSTPFALYAPLTHLQLTALLLAFGPVEYIGQSRQLSMILPVVSEYLPDKHSSQLLLPEAILYFPATQ